MIQSLIETIKLNLAKSTEEFSAENILDQPIPSVSSISQLPTIAIYPGKLEFQKSRRDMSESQPRLRKARQTIDVGPSPSQKEHTLNNTPLKGTIEARLLSDIDSVDGRCLKPIEATDFSIDVKPPKISFKKEFKLPGKVYLDYSYVGVLTTKEFQQELSIDFYDTDLAKVEKLNALTIGVVLTDYNDLIETSNEIARSRYPSEPVSVIPNIEGVEILEAIPEIQKDLCRLQLKLQVSGSLQIVREIIDDPNFIKSVASPGTDPEHGFRIRIQENHDTKWSQIYSQGNKAGAKGISPKAFMKPKATGSKKKRI